PMQNCSRITLICDILDGHLCEMSCPSCSSCHPASTNSSAKGCVCKELFSDKCHSRP
uniref:Uncharacterized protein n=1 Tax=Naja naja TaxID=35670 RepID=A0A8C6XES4_NAJNA